MLPKIAFQNATNGEHLLTFQTNAAQTAASRSVAGGLLQLPFASVPSEGQRPPFEVVLISGFLCWGNEPSGLLVPAQAVVYGMQYLDVPITDEQIERLERLRDGGDALFALQVRALVRIPDGVVAANLTHATQYTIPREKWLALLEQLGFGKRRLIELPSVPTGLGGKWDEASSLLASATRRLAAGDVGAALGEGRTAMERSLGAIGAAIGRPRGDGESVRTFVDALVVELDDKHVSRSEDPYAALAQSVRLAYELFGFASDPGHKGLHVGDRATAELGLTLATALYVYFARIVSAAAARAGA